MPDDKPFNLDDIDFGHTIRGHQKGDRVFERFVLKKLLGRGGMGVVWLAADERLGREVALKFAPEAIRYDDLAVEELKEETRKGLNLAHPNIVKIYDFLLDEEHAAISMEYIEGENLGALRARQPAKVFEPHQIARWVDQLLDALDYAHRGARVIHRDLKPANLMIDREGDLRVTDFGIARSISDALSRATMAGNSTGTLAYMSPQQADGRKPHVTDDLYALGSTLYELLTGKPPFFSGNIAHRLRDEPVTSLTDRRREFEINSLEPLPVEWEQTILSCLEKEAEGRPASAEIIRQRLGLVPNSPVHIPGHATGLPGGGGPETTYFGDTLTSMPTSRTQVQVRSNAGLTEVNAPGRPILAGNVKVSGAAATAATGAASPPKKGNAGLIIALVIGLLVLSTLGGGAWWAMKNTAWLASLTSLVQGKKDPPPPTKLVQDPTIKTSPPVTPAVAKFTTVQSAINGASSGETVVVPSGIYEEQLRFKDGIILQAEEAGKVVVQIDGNVGSPLIVENCGSGSIRGFVFQHTGKDVTADVSWPVALIKSSSITLENCSVLSGVGDGALITGAGKPRLIHCFFKNNRKTGLIFESGTTGTITGSEARKNGQSGVEVRYLGTHPVFHSSTFSENGECGLVVKDGGSATVLEKTACKDNSEAGISAFGEGVTINVKDAVMQANLIGIYTAEGARAQISECQVTGSKQAGLHFLDASEGCEALNNTISDSVGDGICGIRSKSMSGFTLSVIGNKCHSNAGSGIAVFGDGFRPNIERNDCLNNALDGILVAEGAGGVVRDNTVRGNRLGGVTRSKAAPDVVIEGNLTDTVLK